MLFKLYILATVVCLAFGIRCLPKIENNVWLRRCVLFPFIIALIALSSELLKIVNELPNTEAFRQIIFYYAYIIFLNGLISYWFGKKVHHNTRNDC